MVIADWGSEPPRPLAIEYLRFPNGRVRHVRVAACPPIMRLPRTAPELLCGAWTTESDPQPAQAEGPPRLCSICEQILVVELGPQLEDARRQYAAYLARDEIMAAIERRLADVPF
jgi:hypothetical protein